MNFGIARRLCRKLTAVVALCALSTAFAQSGKQQHAHLALISAHNTIARGQPDWIGLRFDLEPGWHIYWINPGDSGEPPKIEWHLPAGMEAGDLQFPVPQRIPDHSLMDYGYQGNVVLLSRLTTSNATASKQAEISADVRYLVCREVCVPGRDHVSMTLPISGRSEADSTQIRAAENRMPQPLPPGVRVSAASTTDGFMVIVASKSQSLGKISDFIPAEEQVIENTATPLIDSRNGNVVIKLKKSEQLDHPISELRGLLVAGDRAYNISIPVNSNQSNTQHRKKS
jgi:DsbC/DsbD-like thiol-disulfide interchange protein